MDKKRIIAAFSVVSILSSGIITACSGTSDSGSDKYSGHWTIDAASAGGEVIDLQFLNDYLGTDESDSIYLDIEKDGSFVLNLYGDNSDKGKWKVSGDDSIILTIDDDDQTVNYKNGKLEMSHGEGDSKLSLIFVKK